jgi:hypothetical protein
VRHSQRRRAWPRLELLEARDLPAAFLPGDLVVSLIGNGTVIAGGTAGPVSLDEFQPNGALVQTLALPSSTNMGTTTALTLPQSAFEGFLNRSADGRYLDLIGENLDAGTANADSSIGARVIGRIDASGNIDLTTFVPDFSTHEVDGVVSSDGTQFWANAYTGPNVALNYVPYGNSKTTNSTPLQQFVDNFNTLAVQNGQLYGAPGFANFSPNVDQVGTGLPTGGGQSVTGLPGFAAISAPFPDTQNFVFLKENPAVTGPDTLYIADANSPTQGGGLQKWTYNGTNWQLEYTLTANLASGLRGLTAVLGNNNQATLYATTADLTQLVTVTDTGPGSAFTTLATAPANDNFNGVALAPLASAAATQTAVAANFNPASAGQSVTFTATVLGNSATATPTGTVTFMDGSQTLGTENLQGASGALGEATATLTSATLGLGAHSITAAYGGDHTFAGSTSAPLAENILSQASITSTVGTSANPAPVGGSLTFTATVAPASGSGSPTGTVTFDVNGSPLGVATVVNGTASLTTTAQLFIGTYAVTAAYSGDGTFGASSSSSALSQQIVQATSSTTVTSNPAPDILGTPSEVDDVSVLTATVTNNAGFVPTGTVTFMNGATVLQSGVSLNSGTALLVVNTVGAPSLPLGANSITAVYSGDTNDTASTSAAFNQVETQFGDSLGLAASVSKTSVTFTATIAPESDGMSTPATGTITFYNFGKAFGTATVSNDTGVLTVSLTTPGTFAGSFYISATYSGDSNFAFSATTTPVILTSQTAFKAGDILVLQAGDGFTAYNTNATDVFLDEYTPSGALVQRVALPEANAGSAHALTVGGFDSSTGLLAQSANGLYVTLAGYDAAPGTVNETNTVNRTVARIDGSANVDTSTLVSGFRSGADIRGAVSNDGGEFWVTGQGSSSNFGMRYLTFGSTNSSQEVVTPANNTAFSIRSPGIFNNTLYATTSFTGQSFIEITPPGGGLPTMNLPLPNSDEISPPGLDAASNPGFSGSVNEFIFFHRNGAGTAPDTLYVADGTNGLLKFSFNGTTWVQEGSANISGINSGLIGLTGFVDPSGNVELYATDGFESGNQLVRFVDTAPFNAPVTGSFTVLATSGSESEFRGVAFTPLVATTTSLTSTPNPSQLHQVVTFTATVAGVNGVNPTGTVTFMDGTTVLGTARLTTAHQAIFKFASLSVGSHSITAVYSGDSFYQTSTSPILTQVVQGGDLAGLGAEFEASVGGAGIAANPVTGSIPLQGAPLSQFANQWIVDGSQGAVSALGAALAADIGSSLPPGVGGTTDGSSGAPLMGQPADGFSHEAALARLDSTATSATKLEDTAEGLLSDAASS